jgi:hypothetical protein
MNVREVCECDGWVCVLEVIDDPSRLRLTRKDATLTRISLDLNYEETVTRRKWKSPLVEWGSWTPELEKKRSVSRWICKNKSHTNLLCNLPVHEVELGGLLLYSDLYFRILSVEDSLSDQSISLGYTQVFRFLSSLTITRVSGVTTRPVVRITIISTRGTQCGWGV